MNTLSRRHLATMLDRHRRWCRDNCVEVPAEVVELLNLIIGDHERAEGDAGQDLLDTAPVPPLAYDYGTAARMLGGVSVPTVRRLVSSGALRAVSVGARRVVPRDELQDYLARQKESC